MFDPLLSTFRGSTNSHPVSRQTLAHALDTIQHGAYARHVWQVQHILKTHGEEAYRVAKRDLPAITFGGTFAPTRTKPHLQQHSGLVHGDLDHLAKPEATKRRLAEDPYIAYAFISPSLTGVKFGVPVAPVADDTGYKHAWLAVRDYCFASYGVSLDESGKEINRLCYVSYDPSLYRNPDARLFEVPPPAQTAPKPITAQTPYDLPRDQRERYAQWGIERATRIIEDSVPGNRHFARCRASYLLGGYVAGGWLSESEAYDALAAVVARHTEHLQQSLKTIADGLVAGQSEPITLEELAPRHPATSSYHAADEDPWAGPHTLPLRPFRVNRLGMGVHRA
jgi:VirE N-terminal domain